LLSLLFYTPDSQSPDPLLESDKKILIVGAGAAGIAAANQLTQFGYSVTVLEARDRIGGRVHTDSGRLDGAKIDLGASIITGLIGNPLDNPHTQLNLRTVPIDESASIYFKSDGSGVPEDMDKRMGDLFNNLLDRLAKRTQDNRNAPVRLAFCVLLRSIRLPLRLDLPRT
jgi:phytoene dehydrogenase-like protein